MTNNIKKEAAGKSLSGKTRVEEIHAWMAGRRSDNQSLDEQFRLNKSLSGVFQSDPSLLQNFAFSDLIENMYDTHGVCANGAVGDRGLSKSHYVCICPGFLGAAATDFKMLTLVREQKLQCLVEKMRTMNWQLTYTQIEDFIQANISGWISEGDPSAYHEDGRLLLLKSAAYHLRAIFKTNRKTIQQADTRLSPTPVRFVLEKYKAAICDQPRKETWSRQVSKTILAQDYQEYQERRAPKSMKPLVTQEKEILLQDPGLPGQDKSASLQNGIDWVLLRKQVELSFGGHERIEPK